MVVILFQHYFTMSTTSTYIHPMSTTSTHTHPQYPPPPPIHTHLPPQCLPPPPIHTHLLHILHRITSSLTCTTDPWLYAPRFLHYFVGRGLKYPISFDYTPPQTHQQMWGHGIGHVPWEFFESTGTFYRRVAAGWPNFAYISTLQYAVLILHCSVEGVWR